MAVVCCSYASQDAVAKVALEDAEEALEEDEDTEAALEKLTNELRVYQDLASLQGALTTTSTCCGLVSTPAGGSQSRMMSAESAATASG